MNFTARPNIARWFIIIASLIITSLILWNVSLFFDQLKDAERSKVEVYAAAFRVFSKTNEVSLNPKDREARILLNELTSLQTFIIIENETIPILVYNLEDENYQPNSVLNAKEYTQEEFEALSEKYALINEPITLGYDGVDSQILYYGNSDTLSQIKYFPIALVIIVVLFLGLIYFYYLSSKQGSQSLLWACLLYTSPSPRD